MCSDVMAKNSNVRFKFAFVLRVKIDSTLHKTSKYSLANAKINELSPQSLNRNNCYDKLLKKS